MFHRRAKARSGNNQDKQEGESRPSLERVPLEDQWDDQGTTKKETLMPKILFALIVSFFMSVPVAAMAQDISVENAEVRANTVPGRPAALYFTMTNKTDTAHVLKAISSPVVNNIMIHESTNVDGVRRMEHRNHAVVPAGGELTFERGAWHGMLMGTSKLKIGETITLTFTFVDHAPLTIQAPIKGLMD